jgi:hypothetical protein
MIPLKGFLLFLLIHTTSITKSCTNGPVQTKLKRTLPSLFRPRAWFPIWVLTITTAALFDWFPKDYRSWQRGCDFKVTSRAWSRGLSRADTNITHIKLPGYLSVSIRGESSFIITVELTTIVELRVTFSVHGWQEHWAMSTPYISRRGGGPGGWGARECIQAFSQNFEYYLRRKDILVTTQEIFPWLRNIFYKLLSEHK